MNYLTYLNPVETEITIEKLDKVARTLNEKVKSFAKFFAVLIGWLVFNVVFSLFVNRTHSLSLDSCRLIADGLRSLETQDIFFVITIIFENKISYVVTLAMVIACGGGISLCASLISTKPALKRRASVNVINILKQASKELLTSFPTNSK